MAEKNPGGSAGGDRAADLRQAVDAYLADKGKGERGDSGNYRRNAGRVLETFADWLTIGGVTALGELEPRHLRQFTREKLLGQDYSPRTVHKYYDYVSAFIGWAEREGLVSEHHGIKTKSREPLPDLDERKRRLQQTWRDDERREILEYVDTEAREAIDTLGVTPSKAVRDRALVYLLAYSGIRASEFLKSRHDDRRDGATWGDLAAGYATLTVLAKDQSIEERAIPPQARDALERWETVLEPEDDWPIVPTFDYGTLYGQLPDGVVTDLSGHEAIFDAYRDREGVSPPAMTTDGARRRLRALTNAAGIDVEEDYLQLHGARRGVGLVLATEQGADAAADQLGNSVRVVEEAYSDVLAEERADQTGAAFENHDR